MEDSSERLRINTFYKCDVIEGLYCDSLRKSLTEITVHQKTARRVATMNFNGEATFLLTSGVTRNERACGKNCVMRPPAYVLFH